MDQSALQVASKTSFFFLKSGSNQTHYSCPNPFYSKVFSYPVTKGRYTSASYVQKKHSYYSATA